MSGDDAFQVRILSSPFHHVDGREREENANELCWAAPSLRQGVTLDKRYEMYNID